MALVSHCFTGVSRLPDASQVNPRRTSCTNAVQRVSMISEQIQSDTD
jgi:hypothetical protein